MSTIGIPDRYSDPTVKVSIGIEIVLLTLDKWHWRRDCSRDNFFSNFWPLLLDPTGFHSAQGAEANASLPTEYHPCTPWKSQSTLQKSGLLYIQLCHQHTLPPACRRSSSGARRRWTSRCNVVPRLHRVWGWRLSRTVGPWPCATGRRRRRWRTTRSLSPRCEGSLSCNGNGVCCLESGKKLDNFNNNFFAILFEH